MADASEAVLGSVIVITGSTVIKDIATTGFHMRPVISGFMLGSVLLLVSFWSPALAKALGYMGIVGALTTNGPTVVKQLRSING